MRRDPKTITGTAGNDNLRGTRGADVISGRAGNDTIRGLAGNDRLVGGKGNDRLYGNAGRDSYSCGAGKDIVFADAVETAGADCEEVRRPAPPPEPEPPPLSVPAGRYVFVTSQGNMDALVRGADWARVGTNGANEDGAFATATTEDAR